MPFSGKGGENAEVRQFSTRSVVELINAIGGEALAGSGFEAQEPEPGFSAAELEGEE